HTATTAIFPLSLHDALPILRSIAKVSDAHGLDKKTKRKFKPLGAIAYDAGIMTYKPDHVVSLWCIGGRQKIDFVCHRPEHIPLVDRKSTRLNSSHVKISYAV